MIYNFDEFSNRIIFGREARFPKCFPDGYPRDAPLVRCYDPGWGGSLISTDIPCLPPIFNGVIIPPCYGPYVAIIVN